ncbi:transposase, partial [Escherichia coli]|uniref:transposase n=1 Tax=Escherichia coli TaxID=562 RepID=UPI000B6EC046
MTKNTRFSPEVRQRAVRMVLESQGEYDSQWAAIRSIAPKIGCTPETLRVWVRQHERDTGCLVYPSAAADDMQWLDLGGPRF